MADDQMGAGAQDGSAIKQSLQVSPDAVKRELSGLVEDANIMLDSLKEDEERFVVLSYGWHDSNSESFMRYTAQWIEALRRDLNTFKELVQKSRAAVATYDNFEQVVIDMANNAMESS